jgi:hypothetical protein
MSQHPMYHHEKKKRQIACQMNNIADQSTIHLYVVGLLVVAIAKAQTNLTKLGQGLQLRTKIG